MRAGGAQQAENSAVTKQTNHHKNSNNRNENRQTNHHNNENHKSSIITITGSSYTIITLSSNRFKNGCKYTFRDLPFPHTFIHLIKHINIIKREDLERNGIPSQVRLFSHHKSTPSFNQQNRITMTTTRSINHLIRHITMRTTPNFHQKSTATKMN